MSIKQIANRIVITIFIFIFVDIGISLGNEINSNEIFPIIQKNHNVNSVIIKILISKKFNFTNKSVNQGFSFLIYPNPVRSNSINVVLSNKPSDPINYKLIDFFTNKTIAIDQRYIQENRIHLQDISNGKYILTVQLDTGEIHSQNIEITK